jgi:hypothetical protein
MIECMDIMDYFDRISDFEYNRMVEYYRAGVNVPPPSIRVIPYEEWTE